MEYIRTKDNVWHNCDNEMPPITTDVYFLDKEGGIHEGKLYAVLQDHTILPHYFPSVNTASLYVEVTPDYTEEGEELGTIDNPIPYEGNMVLENGKYYSQNGVVYLCTRDSINPIYHPLSALVGQYVEEV